MVELPIRQDLARPPTNRAIVVLAPALLQGDDVRRGGHDGELAADLVEALGAQVGDVQ